MIEKTWVFPFSENQRDSFKTGELWRKWSKQFPDIFDEDDIRIVKTQHGRGIHYYEWLAAILMYETPELVRMGADRISVHYEACLYPRRVLRHIASLGAQAGIAFNPATPLPDLAYLRPYLSFVVLLTTEPEVTDCSLLPEVLEKVRRGRQFRGLEGIEWVLDGGINPENLDQVVQAGADSVVIGRAVFKDGKIAENIRALRAMMS